MTCRGAVDSAVDDVVRVTVVTGDGFDGYPAGALPPSDRHAGLHRLSPLWLDQLPGDGTLVVPLAHGGVHAIVAVRRSATTLAGRAGRLATFPGRPGSSGRFCHSAMPSSTLSVMVEMFCFDTSAPYTKARCALISPVVMRCGSFAEQPPTSRPRGSGIDRPRSSGSAAKP
jgi:hypothetical protein